MKNRALIIAFATIALLFTTQTQAAQSQYLHQMHLSTRAMGMGGAFTAVADDYNALYFNPAGLPRLEEGQLNLGIQGGFTPTILNFYNDMKSAGNDTVRMTNALLNYVGSHFSSRVGVGGVWARPNWAIGVQLVDLTVEADIRGSGGVSVGVEAYQDSTIQFGYGWNLIGGEKSEKHATYIKNREGKEACAEGAKTLVNQKGTQAGKQVGEQTAQQGQQAGQQTAQQGGKQAGQQTAQQGKQAGQQQAQQAQQAQHGQQGQHGKQLGKNAGNSAGSGSGAPGGPSAPGAGTPAANAANNAKPVDEEALKKAEEEKQAADAKRAEEDAKKIEEAKLAEKEKEASEHKKEASKSASLSVGVAPKVVYRAYYENSLTAIDLATSTDLFRMSDAQEGMTFDFDIGGLYTFATPDEGFMSWTRYARPTLGVAVRNVVDAGFPTNFKLLSKQSSNLTQKLERRFDVGTKFELPEFWVFKPRFMVDARDMGTRYASFKKCFHVGAELLWKAFGWLQGGYRVGLSQGYITAGVSAKLAVFNLDLATYAEEVGATDTPRESRRYMARLSLDF